MVYRFRRKSNGKGQYYRHILPVDTQGYVKFKTPVRSGKLPERKLFTVSSPRCTILGRAFGLASSNGPLIWAAAEAEAFAEAAFSLTLVQQVLSVEVAEGEAEP
jgi:hypothetical protein